MGVLLYDDERRVKVRSSLAAGIARWAGGFVGQLFEWRRSGRFPFAGLLTLRRCRSRTGKPRTNPAIKNKKKKKWNEYWFCDSFSHTTRQTSKIRLMIFAYFLLHLFYNVRQTNSHNRKNKMLQNFSSFVIRRPTLVYAYTDLAPWFIYFYS